MVGTLAAGRREPTAPAAGAACARVDSIISTALANSTAPAAASADSTAAVASVDSTAVAGGASVRDSPTSDDSGGRRNEHVSLTRVEQGSRCSRGRVFGADHHDCVAAFVPAKVRQHGGGYHD